MPSDTETPSDREALNWFVSLRDHNVTERDRARFAAWLDMDPRNRRAWLELEAIWSAMDRLDPLASGQPAATARIALPARRQERRIKWRAAATIVVLAGLAALSVVRPPDGIRALLADYSSGIESRRDVTLPDGSAVSLGASSALSVEFDEHARRVVLHHGEAYFSVVPDPSHPFVVEAANGAVTVVGTKFNVEREDDRVVVSVADGSVTVAVGPGAPIRLKPGQRVQYDARGFGTVRAVDIADVASWREGRLIFNSTPLGEILADLERHRHGRILVTDPELAALPVTGTFDVRRGDAALDTIAQTLPVTVTKVTDLLVLVSLKPSE